MSSFCMYSGMQEWVIQTPSIPILISVFSIQYPKKIRRNIPLITFSFYSSTCVCEERVLLVLLLVLFVCGIVV